MAGKTEVDVSLCNLKTRSLRLFVALKFLLLLDFKLPFINFTEDTIRERRTKKKQSEEEIIQTCVSKIFAVNSLGLDNENGR